MSDAPSHATPHWSADLNPQQHAAATHGDGPLLIVAGAGTGKTRTLVYRVAHLIEYGIRPERILLLTFTRRAAQEMLRRAERLVGAASTRVQGGTFHATAHRLLRAYGEAAGIPRDFSILDQSDAEDLTGMVRAALGLGERGSRFPKKETLHHVYSRHVNTDVPVDDILRDEYPQFTPLADDFRRVFAAYTDRKSERNLLDYDDLLLFWAAMLDVPAIGERIAGRYDHVLVDEYQDTNVLQARILRGMCRAHSNLTVVGDDAQSIYSFRGATIRNILEFPEQFPGAARVTLEQNYRSTQPILDVANTLIARAPRGYGKTLWTERRGGEAPLLVAARDEHEQTQWVVQRVLEFHEQGLPLSEMAVLFRAGYMSADLEIELTNRHIPFEKWGGLKFLEAAHVKDVLAFLRVLENPRDEVSWFRLLLLLPGIGDVSARRAIETLAASGWDPDALAHFVPPARARDALAALVDLLAESRRAEPDPDAPVSADIARIRRLYDDILRSRYDRVDPRLADLDQLTLIAANFPTRAAFLAELALDPPSATQDLAGPGDAEDDVLILSTAHSAKGREWDAVFVIWAADGWFPSARSLRTPEEIEEERRLLYVAMTRARRELAISYPLYTYAARLGADYAIDQPSRFLDAEVRARMRLLGVGGFDTGTAPADAAPASAAVDLRDLLRQRFGAS